MAVKKLMWGVFPTWLLIFVPQMKIKSVCRISLERSVDFLCGVDFLPHDEKSAWIYFYEKSNIIPNHSEASPYYGVNAWLWFCVSITNMTVKILLLPCRNDNIYLASCLISNSQQVFPNHFNLWPLKTNQM